MAGKAAAGEIVGSHYNNIYPKKVSLRHFSYSFFEKYGNMKNTAKGAER